MTDLRMPELAMDGNHYAGPARDPKYGSIQISVTKDGIDQWVGCAESQDLRFQILADADIPLTMIVAKPSGYIDGEVTHKKLRSKKQRRA